MKGLPDDAVAERFFLTLKTEGGWRRAYANHGELRRDVADDIVGFHNAVRIQYTRCYLLLKRYESYC